MRFFDVVEYPGNIRTAMIPTNKELHHGQMHLSVGGRDIIVRMNWDIRHKIVPLRIWIGVCIHEHQFVGGCFRCRYLSNIG